MSVFQKQFEVIFVGWSSYSEDDPLYGYYTMDYTVSGGNASLISEAVALAERIVREENYEFRDPDTAYWDEDLAHYSGPVDFYADHIRIIDRNNRLVIGGVVRGDSAEWIEPVYEKHLCERIKAHQESIHAEASVEAG